MDSSLSAAPLAATPVPQPAHAAGPAATARSFEAVFVGQMVRIMMDTTPSDGPFNGGHGEEMFRGVLAEQLGTTIASGRGIGLASIVMKEIVRLQGGAAHVD